MGGGEGGGGGSRLPYISHIGMCPPPGRVFAPFGSENGYILCPLWSGIGLGTMECRNVLIVSIPNE